MPTTSFTDQPIFITGLPRSGTSLLAGLLGCCGAWTGQTVAGDTHNPKGYFEHTRLRERIVKPILTSLKADPLGVDPLPPFIPALKIKHFREQVTEIIGEDGYDGARPWLYKDAKLSLIWPAFVEAFPNARWILVTRSIEDITRSCMNTPFMAQHSQKPEFWQHFVTVYQVHLQKLLESTAHTRMISAESLLAGDFQALKTLTAEYGLEFDAAAINDFICRDYWHGETGEPSQS